jgi:hypothetical protein
MWIFKKVKYVLYGKNAYGVWEEIDEFNYPISSKIINRYPQYSELRLEKRDNKRRIKIMWYRINPYYQPPLQLKSIPNKNDIIKGLEYVLNLLKQEQKTQ